MKRLSIILLFFVLISGHANPTYAQQASCPNDEVFDSSTGLCWPKDSAQGIAAEGQQSLDQQNQQQTQQEANQLNGDAAANGGAGNAGQNDTGGSNTHAFVPLSNIQAFTKLGDQPSLPAFLNDLYKICIGLAVVIAVLQLIRGGITYMLVDSVTTKEQARHSITAAVLGLVLVLSPYIVFSVINPHILDLDISDDLNNLQTNADTTSIGNNTPTVSNQSCQGFTSYKEVDVPAGQSCSDVLKSSTSGGWVGIDKVCCFGLHQSTVETAQCCALDPSVKTYPPATYYESPNSIPKGDWCYQTSNGYECNTDQNSCSGNRQNDSSATADCKQYTSTPTGAASYAFSAYLVEGAGSGSCRSEQASSEYPDLATCQSAMSASVSSGKANKNAAVYQDCNGKPLNPPQPSEAWNVMKNLPAC